ncbi:winged helix-turn-helix transcriptional regulator [Allorhizocola rhizosphaerae]|uniref:winged helix-turn-helix transcriptional regulator n=1 Tax=Allorhizocola rhizosphaerae TaxID=1872709 RepID=UPI001B8CE40E|nr:helix-turn-helix domain-containing protein [Allorhizocola rhizosphaerae]
MTKRSYDDRCASAHALDLIGERWALLVVRELLLGPKRFTDLRADLPGVSPNVLSQRLDELERVAVIRRRRLSPPAAAWVYELTDWGAELEPIILQLGRWGARSPFLNAELPLSVDAMALEMRTFFDPSTARGLKASYELRFGEHRYHACVNGSRFEIGRGPAAAPDAVIDSDPNTLAAVIYDGADVGMLRFAGDRFFVERFVKLFTLPDKALVAATT